MGNKQCKQNAITPDFVKKFIECGESFLDDPCGPLSCLKPLHGVFVDAKDAIENNKAPLHAHLDPDSSDEISVVTADGVDEAIMAMISVANNMNEKGIGYFTFNETADVNADSSALALITTFLVTSQGNYATAAESINRTNLPQLYGNYSQVGLQNQVQTALDINEVMKMILFPSTVAQLDPDEFLFVSTHERDNKLVSGTLVNLLTGCSITADECGPVCLPPGLYVKHEEKKKKKCKKHKCRCDDSYDEPQNMWSASGNGGAIWNSCPRGFDEDCEKPAPLYDCGPVIIGPKSDPYIIPMTLQRLKFFNGSSAAKNPRDEFVSRFR